MESMMDGFSEIAVFSMNFLNRKSVFEQLFESGPRTAIGRFSSHPRTMCFSGPDHGVDLAVRLLRTRSDKHAD
jgi:hypothetical protein